MKTNALAIGLFFISAFCFAQSTDVELKLTLRDGNVVSGTSKINNISLTTDYGKLDIPLKNVSALDLGIVADKATTDKVSVLAKQLGNSDEKMRKAAFDELLKLDIKAIPAISNFMAQPAYEAPLSADYTLDGALAELQAKYNVENGFSSKDVVAIDYEYSMGGSYDFAKIDLKTEYGTLSIPKEKIKHIDVLYSGGSESGDMVFKLTGSKHISSNPNGGWLKTGIMVKAGQKVSITATGEITFASLSGSKYKPDGTIVGSTTPAVDSYEGDYGAGAAYPTYGNVVYKVGESSTQVLKAGAKYSGAMQTSGMLFISIYETVYNASNSGGYTVKISLK